LADKSQEATKLQLNILWWAKAATWVGVTIILVMIALPGADETPLQPKQQKNHAATAIVTPDGSSRNVCCRSYGEHTESSHRRP
jgi:hypothetical protein